MFEFEFLFRSALILTGAGIGAFIIIQFMMVFRQSTVGHRKEQPVIMIRNEPELMRVIEAHGLTDERVEEAVIRCLKRIGIEVPKIEKSCYQFHPETPSKK